MHFFGLLEMQIVEIGTRKYIKYCHMNNVLFRRRHSFATPARIFVPLALKNSRTALCSDPRSSKN